MHKLEILNQSLITAKRRIEVGELYYHYRTPNQFYRVLAIALDEATGKPCVVYQALYGEQLVWVRDLNVWCDKVEHEGQIIPRFIKQ